MVSHNCERLLLCIIVGCGNKNGKSSQKRDSVVKFSRVPKIVKNEGEVIEELTPRKGWAWLSAVSHDDLENEGVCVWPSCQTVGPN